jgi:hypothetical protein
MVRSFISTLLPGRAVVWVLRIEKPHRRFASITLCAADIRAATGILNSLGDQCCTNEGLRGGYRGSIATSHRIRAFVALRITVR